jgi:hypothetical protein
LLLSIKYIKSILFLYYYYYYCRKIRENRYDEIVSNDMLALLSADSEDTINKLFDNILKNDENTTS